MVSRYSPPGITLCAESTKPEQVKDCTLKTGLLDSFMESNLYG